MSLVKHSLEGVEPITSDLDGWTPVEGSPSMTTWIEYSAPDGSLIAGTWQATPGTYRAEYAAYEFVHLIEGRIAITPDGGETVIMVPGDAFSVEANFKGEWKILEAVRKHFVIKLA